MNKLTQIVAAILFCLPLATASAQTIGSTQETHAYDNIDLASLAVTLRFPALSRGGPVPLSLSFGGDFSISVFPAGFFYPNGLGALGALPSSLLGVIQWAGSKQVNCGLGQVADKLTNPWFEEYSFSSYGPRHSLPPLWYMYDTPVGSCKNPTSQAGYTLDSSGLYVDTVANTVTTPSGLAFNLTTLAETDPNGNSATEFTTSLGQPFVTSTGATWSYYDATGVQQQSYSLMSSFPATLQSNWGCTSGNKDYTLTRQNVATSLKFPDGTSLGITQEPTVGYPGNVTGRITQLTLPTGGTISYSYTGGDAPGPGIGIYCNPLVNVGTTPVLTRTLSDGSARTYTTNYQTGTSTIYSTTTVTDPSGNNTIHTFFWGSAGSNPIEVKTQTYQGGGVNCNNGCSSTNLLRTVTYCYDNLTSSANCDNPSVTPVNWPGSLFTEQDVYVTIPGVSPGPSEIAVSYDGFGNVTTRKEYDFGATTPTYTTTITYGTYKNGACDAVGSHIVNRPCEVIVSGMASGNSVNIADTRYTYDGSGNKLSVSRWTGTTWLTPTAIYNPNGTLNTTYDAQGTPTQYAYGYCNGLLPSLISTADPVTYFTLSSSFTWDCLGAVLLTATDPSDAVSTNSYTVNGADPFYAPKSSTRPLGEVVTDSYATTSFKSAISVGSSSTSLSGFTDSLGRPFRSQSKHGNGFDLVTDGVSWGAMGLVQTASSIPYSGGSGSSCSGTCPVNTRYFDALGRLSQFVDANSQVLTKTYPGKDIVTVLSPAPSGESVKKSQTEFDGLGRVTSTCAIQSSGGTSCGQATGGYSGIPVSYTYTPLSGGTQIQVNNGLQTVTTVKDAIGRTTSINSPEAGLSRYFYDTSPSACIPVVGNVASNGDLVATEDNAGTYICRQFDNFHRIVFVNTTGTSTHCIRYAYDTPSNGVLGAAPNGVVVNNGLGRLIEAETDTCASPVTQSSIVTDEWFSYDKEGNITDVWESTPHSGGYYHSSATYYIDGHLNTLNVPGYSTITYGLDPDTKPYSMTDGSTTVVGSVTYDTSANPLTVSIGSNGDSDTYTYDNVEHPKSYTFSVNGKSDLGTYGWNANGTLGSLAITDTFNSGGTQTCNFGYDDVIRLTSYKCPSVWSQTFSYDQHGNIAKSGSGSWACTACYNTANNRYNNVLSANITYDANGRLTYDTFNYYNWDTYGKLSTVGQSPVCGTSGTCFTYDAMGQVVEKSLNTVYTEYLISPIGKIGYLSGQTELSTFVPLPGGGTLFSTGPSGATARRVQHVDGSGSVPLETDFNSRTFVYDRAFAPYGELYNNFGTTGDYVFGGDQHDYDAAPNLFDGLGMYHSSQGRSIQPPYAR